MWRIGVLALATLFVQLTLADVKNGFDNPIVQRLKRSPQYDNCRSYPPPPPPPYWPRHHPRYWPPPPPPPPPPYWPPPPPPPPPPAPPPPPPQPDQYQVYTIADSEAKSNAATIDSGIKNPPCSTCGNNGQSNAVSNAESKTGQAIAVAIARANTQ